MFNLFIVLSSLCNVLLATSVQRPLCGENEIEVKCKTVCPPQFCNISYTDYVCEKNIPCTRGCDCKKNYLRDDRGICILNDNCPPPLQCNGPNEVKSDCLITCPGPTCKDLDKAFACEPFPPCQPGCNCLAGFFRNSNGICVTEQECRNENCGVNEVYTDCKKTCPSEKCTSIGKKFNCSSTPPCKPGCKCMDDYFRNDKGRCVPRQKCPNPGPKCGLHEYYELCPDNCQRRLLCSSLWSKFTCPPDDGSCKPNCTCVQGYLRDDDTRRCIRTIDQCIHHCADNENYVENSTQCQRTCANRLVTDSDSQCKPYYGCVCAPGLVRTNDDATGPCIQEEKCCDIPPEDDCSEDPEDDCSEDPEDDCSEDPEDDCSDEPEDDCSDEPEPCEEPPQPKCPVPRNCRPTCAVPNPENCEFSPDPKENVDGCQCKSGYILSDSDGKCVKIQDCPKYTDSCNYDKNATIRECPPPCPSTCEAPNQSPCKRMCLKVGCHCKPGYIRSSIDGQCILPKDCKGGVKCPKNAVYVPCKISCPTDYCPKDDRRGIVACDPPEDCPSGCVCKFNHKLLSHEDPKCIPTKNCPPLNCTSRPNECYEACPSPCLAENCKDKDNQPSVCNTFAPVACSPTCICKPDTFRNSSGICVPRNECQPPKPKCPVPRNCRPTCAVPNPENCKFSPDPKENVDGCQCKSGYILSDSDGKCVKIQDCPKYTDSCNCDKNATIRECPPPCPSTCEAPNQSPCKKMCLKVGCHCNPGYLRSSIDGQCILPKDCKGGVKCPKNSVFAPCNVRCPNAYCPKDDRRGIVACDPPRDCPSGCVCKFNHKLLSREDPRCIPTKNCPPLNCTSRPNECYEACPSPCLAEYCRDKDNQPSVCNTFAPVECSPTCICKPDTFRNSSDICVPRKKCPKVNIPSNIK